MSISQFRTIVKAFYYIFVGFLEKYRRAALRFLLRFFIQLEQAFFGGFVN